MNPVEAALFFFHRLTFSTHKSVNYIVRKAMRYSSFWIFIICIALVSQSKSSQADDGSYYPEDDRAMAFHLAVWSPNNWSYFTNSGGNWVANSPTTYFGAGSGGIAVDSGGKFHMSFGTSVGDPIKTIHYYSDVTGVKTDIGVYQDGFNQQRSAIAVSSNGTIGIVHSGQNYGISYDYKLPGTNWTSTPTTLLYGNSTYPMENLAITRGLNNYMHITASRKDGLNSLPVNKAWPHISYFNGLAGGTFGSELVLDKNGSGSICTSTINGGVAVAANGLARIVYLCTISGQTNVVYGVGSYAGFTFVNLGAANAYVRPAIAVDASDRTQIVYADTSNRLVYRSAASGGAFGAPILIEAAGASALRTPQMAADKSGKIHTFYVYAPASGSARISHCSTTAGTLSTTAPHEIIHSQLPSAVLLGQGVGIY